jgi:hypothetical protein
MTSRLFTSVLVVAVAAVVAAPAAGVAHHGWSGYDSTKELTVTGTVKEAGYEHPHGFVRVQAPGKTWLVVLAPPSRMERRGLPRELLAPGKQATVVGYASKTDGDEMRAERITIDGKTTELR